MKKTFLYGFLYIFLIPAWSQSFGAEDELSISGAYVRGLPPGLETTAAYMEITNRSSRDQVLVGARSPAAKSVMIHRTQGDNGMLSMKHMARLTIPAGATVKLESGAMHLMLMGVEQTLREGDELSLVLVFDGGLELSLQVPVKSVLQETHSH